MKRKWQYFIRSERGDGWLSILFIMLICCILGLTSVSVVQYVMIRSNLRTAANETLQIMKVDNGADSQTRTTFDALLRKMGMEPSKVSFTASPKTVQRGDVLDLTVVRDYNVFALKAIGVELTVPIQVHVSGLAHKFIRAGE